MRRTLSIFILGTTPFFFTPHAPGATVDVTPVRQAGYALGPSLRNEADHAVREGADWLAARQNPDGSWGGPANRVRLTALVLLSLQQAGENTHADACVRAALWLDGTATNALPDLAAHAWRLLAVSRMLAASPSRTRLLKRLSDRARTTQATASADMLALWREALETAGLETPAAPSSRKPAPGARSALAAIADAWPQVPADNARAWRLVRLINREGDGHLLRNGQPLDWRTDLARSLISRQRRDSAGGGFWEAPNPDGKLAETAFGILTFSDL